MTVFCSGTVAAGGQTEGGGETGGQGGAESMTKKDGWCDGQADGEVSTD